MNIGGYEMDVFGDTDPRKMPRHLFFGALCIDYDSAVRANIDQQHFSVCPRHWYIDAKFQCEECRREFVFSVQEQRFWYEERRFWIDSQPRKCAPCRKQDRRTKNLKKQYDSDVAAALSSRDLKTKKAIIAVLDELASAGFKFAERVMAQRDLLLHQIRKAEAEPNAAPNGPAAPFDNSNAPGGPPSVS
jgi:hypothetical protein